MRRFKLWLFSHLSALARIFLIAVSLILILFGGYLILFTTVESVSDTYSSQSTICSLQFSNKLAADQVLQNTCDSEKNGWLSLSLTSTSNLTITLRNNSTVIFNETSTSFAANLPLLSNGNIIVEVRNLEPFTNSIQGSLSVGVMSSQSLSSSFLIQPYRALGIAIAAVFGILMIYLIVYPKQLRPARLWHMRSF